MIRVHDVHKILALMMPMSLNGSSRCRGMANIRGETVPLFDLAGSAAPLLPSRFVLLSRVGDEPIGLIVDEIHDVVTLAEDDLVFRSTGEKRVCVGRLGNDLLLVIEPSEVRDV